MPKPLGHAAVVVQRSYLRTPGPATAGGCGKAVHGMFGLVAAVGIGLVSCAGGYMAVNGTVSLGTIAAFTAYLTRLYGR